ncbi:ATP-binding protein [Spirosoma sp. SC4-14]|uniref:ATP-binding protein n=1 Tax=Spirosoma sp. SC4-14 TaxID=3128900 RepID=UPI0030D13D88
MNRRIRSIFWLMTACIVGINAFQAYWLWKTYQIDRQQFASSAQDALFQALEQQQVGEAKQLFGQKLKDTSQLIIRQFDAPGSRQVRVFFQNHPDTTNQKQTANKQPKRVIVTLNSALNTNSSLNPDSIARRLTSLVMLDWTDRSKIALPKLKKLYQAELKQRGIDADFQLDTITIQPKQAQNNVFIVRTDSRNIKSASAISSIHTAPVPVNPVKNLFVQASFTAPGFYLLSRMGWLLGASLLLLVLTTGCFLFMLSTIMRQKKLSEVKNDFINNMTHELKTPIATVTAAVEALQNFGALNDPQRTQTYLAISQTNLQRLSDLVEKVLNLAVEEKHELILHPEPVDLYELANDLITNHRLRALKPVSFETNIPADAIVTVDRVHFGNALNNLIDNAIKYSREQVTIRLAFHRHSSDWSVSVADNGIGIQKSYQTAIFDRFFRVPTGNLHPVKGFGLGLAYVRQVVERHGGSIAVQSDPERGSEFTMFFTTD